MFVIISSGALVWLTTRLPGPSAATGILREARLQACSRPPAGQQHHMQTPRRCTHAACCGKDAASSSGPQPTAQLWRRRPCHWSRGGPVVDRTPAERRLPTGLQRSQWLRHQTLVCNNQSGSEHGLLVGRPPSIYNLTASSPATSEHGMQQALAAWWTD